MKRTIMKAILLMLSLSLVLLSCKKDVDDGEELIIPPVDTTVLTPVDTTVLTPVDSSIYTDLGDIHINSWYYDGYDVDINNDGLIDVNFQSGTYSGHLYGFSFISVYGRNGWEVFSKDTIASDNIKDVYADTIIYRYRTEQIPVIFSAGDQITDSAYHVQGPDFWYSSGTAPSPGYEYFGCSYGAEIPEGYFYIGLIKPGESPSIAWIKLKIKDDTFTLNSARCYKGVRKVVIR